MEKGFKMKELKRCDFCITINRDYAVLRVDKKKIILCKHCLLDILKSIKD